MFLYNFEGSNKKGAFIYDFMSAFMLVHSPISSLILKACLYFIIIYINLAFSLGVRANSFKSTLDLRN